MEYIYKIKRLKKAKFVMDCSEGYKITPKIKNFSIDSIILYDKHITTYYIEKNYLIKFKKLLEFIKNNDDNEDAGEYILGQIDLLEWIILNEYKKFLSVDMIKMLLKDLYFLKQNTLSKNYIKGKSR